MGLDKFEILGASFAASDTEGRTERGLIRADDVKRPQM